MMRQRNLKWMLLLLLFIVALIISVMHSLSSGELSISIFDIPTILSSKTGLEFTILKNIRLPRIILGLAIGGALSLAGVLLQGIYKNPLVEPYTLGISGGAALGVAIGIVFGLHQRLGSFMLPLLGFAGSMLTVVMVYMLSIRHGKIKIQSMLLIGVMISFIASSGMMFLMATTSSENLHGIIFWIMGSLDEPDTNLIAYALFASILGLIISYLFVQPLNAMRLGENKARNLGINTEATIRILFVVASILTGVSVSVAGVIGFVGLIIPHMIRLTVGNDFRILLISSYIMGGAFIILCDTISRTIISPNELPIGVITGILGGAIFIVVLSRTNLKKRLG